MYLRYGLILLALGVAVWVVRSIGQRLTQSPAEDPAQLQSNQPQQLDPSDGDSQVAEALEEGEEAGEEDDLVLEDDMYTSKLSDEAKARIEARSEMFEEIQDQVEEHPEQTAEMIRAWLVEDGSMP